MNNPPDYVFGYDPASPQGDHSMVAVAHREPDGTIILDGMYQVRTVHHRVPTQDGTFMMVAWLEEYDG